MIKNSHDLNTKFMYNCCVIKSKAVIFNTLYVLLDNKGNQLHVIHCILLTVVLLNFISNNVNIFTDI